MTNQEKAAILQKAIVQLRIGWTQREYARDSEGISCGAASPKACAWDIGGAIFVAAQCDHGIATALVRTLSAQVPVPLYEWNDSRQRTADQVIALLESTIAKLES